MTVASAEALIPLLRAQLAPYRRRILLLLALQVAQGAAVLYLPTLNADIVDNGLLKGDTGYILRLGGAMLAVTVVQVACTVGAVWCGAWVSAAVGRDLRTKIFDRVQTYSSREVAQFGTSSLLTRTTNDVQQVQSLVLASFTMLVLAPIMGLGGVVLAFSQDVLLALALLVVVPALAGLMYLIVRALQPIFRTMQRRVDTVNRVLREQISGIRVIRAFTRDEFEERRFAEVNGGLRDVSLRAGRLTSLMFPLSATVVNLFSVPLVWLGALRIDGGYMQVGALTAFLGYLTVILVAVTTATFMLMMVPRAEVCAERISEVLGTESSLIPPADPVRQLPEPGYLELADVEFRYPGAQDPILRGINLVARPGRTTALIGSTGSGKSTLIGLVPRLADPTGGQVLVGGVDVRNLDPGVLASTVGIVPQAPRLFAGTIASNLRFGRPEATDTELWRALEVAQAREFVEELDGGLSAQVSQGGTNLSGGQRQRLAIARVLIRRPQIYLFDDSFSALDYSTDARVRAALAAEVAEATVVVVAQRISTIRDADQIIVLESGEVVAAGTHDDLLANSSVYREIVLSQLIEEEA
ncbi:ABC transporter ATP-binding protein [Longispora albida]|uniref:ABC transporter ATP-binding protein n=1 Tax=Longispora albida TaxID=203523 RepID=UPI00047649AE|nr:ABC transporter ATP-binding protein [Longispora albida]